jgi:2-polyprenyl-3-methyl-5-hydroxy-6-metoxy-1,4-benzoquinol methylase
MTSNSIVPETADIETSSDGYAARFAGPVGEWMLSVQEKITVAMVAGTPGASVVDVGGGHGQLAGPLCRRGFTVTVLGSDESCRKRIAGLVESGACRFVIGNVVQLPFPDRSFDVAMSFRLLPHCNAWPVLIAELARVAKHSVIVDYPTSEGLNAIAPALFGAKKKLEGNTREWRMFRHAEVDDEFKRHGFVLKQRQPQFFLPMVLHRALHARGLSSAMEKACRGLGLTRRWGSPVIAEYLRGVLQVAGN